MKKNREGAREAGWGSVGRTHAGGNRGEFESRSAGVAGTTVLPSYSSTGAVTKHVNGSNFK
eukprot:3938581-Rhodomonas_salina.1